MPRTWLSLRISIESISERWGFALTQCECELPRIHKRPRRRCPCNDCLCVPRETLRLMASPHGPTEPADQHRYCARDMALRRGRRCVRAFGAVVEGWSGARTKCAGGSPNTLTVDASVAASASGE